MRFGVVLCLLSVMLVLSGCGFGSKPVQGGAVQTREEGETQAQVQPPDEMQGQEQAQAQPPDEMQEQEQVQAGPQDEEQEQASPQDEAPEQTKEPQQPETTADEADREEEGEQEMATENNGGIEILCPEEFAKWSADVDYGELVKTTYYSTTCEKERPVNILLPAGYDESREYPVLYLLHGIFGSQNDMVGSEKSGNRVTIGNMIAKGAAQEMIVVFPYMYASKTQDACTGIDVKNTEAYDNFVNDLRDDLMPFLKANYSVKEGRENTAVAGFSMGGRESLAIALQMQDRIGYVGAIAPAPGLVPGKDWAMEHPGQFAQEELVFDKEYPIVFMICCGDSDKTVGKFPKSYHEIFEQNGQEHIWWEIPGSDHGEPAISSGIYNFCSRIFQ